MKTRSELLTLVSFALALIGSAALLLVPAVGVQSASTSAPAARPDGTVVQQPVTYEMHYETLLESQGAGIIRFLAIPVALTAIPVALERTRFARSARIAVAGLLGVLMVISIFSLGMFYLPAVIAMTLAAASPAAPRSEAGDEA